MYVFLKKYKIFLIIFLLFSIIFFVLFITKKEKSIVKNDNLVFDKIIKTKGNEQKTVKELVVEIKGAVLIPGVYTLKDGSRVIDLINIAGGLSEDANIDYINQSKILEDQMIVKIYTNQEIEKSNKVEIVTKYVEKECNCPKINNDACLDSNINNDNNETEENNSTNNIININSCTLDQLLTLPGIGESKAIAIIEYRKSNKFEKIEDIQNVTGIGASIYEKIKNYIEV